MSIPLGTLNTPPLSPAGSVLTSLEPGRAIVWLSGDIDLALAEILGHLARNLHLLVPHVWTAPRPSEDLSGGPRPRQCLMATQSPAAVTGAVMPVPAKV
jgi:hypothetical protein